MTIANKLARLCCASLAAFSLMLGLSVAQAQTVIYYHTDALGSPVAITNAAGVVIERTEYEPYGQVLNEPVADGPGYTGHVSDAQTGLSYMQQRYYDPQIGRFLSMDPVTADTKAGGNFNRYKYASNNPYRFVDPDGRQETIADVMSYADPVQREAEYIAAKESLHFAAGFVPGVDLARCASSSCGAGGWTLAGLGVIPGGAKGIQLGLRGINTAADAVTYFRNISNTALKAADNVGIFKVSGKHLPGAGGSYAKFAEGVDINGSIANALKSDGARFLPNGDKTDSFILITDMGKQIGSKGETGLKVVIGTDGKIWTAYPTQIR